jgi:GDP-4-dehydro-6-deoxy-D-mannose reductase
MKVLVTGATGFVGAYLAESLKQILGPDIVLIPTSKAGEVHPVFGPTEALDITDRDGVYRAISRHRPAHVVNLAGIAASARAAGDPKAAWVVHVHGALNLAYAILDTVPDCVLVNVGSGLVYGRTAGCGYPLAETALLAPTDHYGVTKASADLALGALVSQGLRCIRFRPFNHTGPGQAVSFVIPSFATQIARIETGLASPVIKVGNLDTKRDFLDVRDVVRAYGLGIRNAAHLEPDAIINVASGQARSIQEILEYMLSLSRKKISVEQDATRVRSSDLPQISGDASYARDHLGWSQEYSLEDTILAVLERARSMAEEKRNTG